jgi:hypothetical protein
MDVMTGERATGRRDHRLGRSPFGPAAPSIAAASVYAVATAAWIVAGDVLPGGRWFAVHLFTLGVLTNLITTFSEHFARTVTRTPGERAARWPLITNLGIVTLLVGVASGARWALVAGAVVVTASILGAYGRLRRMRRAALGARFAWIVQSYERAHGAFVYGAVLGAAMGAGLLSASWHGGARLAHLHATVLGWGGLTLLATLVFFGPTMARTRIEAGADARAARAVRHGATGLAVALVLLLGTALGAGVGTAARVGAALALSVYALAATTVCRSVLRAVTRARRSAARPLVAAVCVWFPAVVWADVVVVATGSWRWLDAVGVAALVGVLGQAVLATLLYLAPMLRGRTTATREALRVRLERGSGLRAALFGAGALAVTLAATRVLPDLPLAGMGWVALLAAAGPVLVAVWWPARRPPVGAG